MSLVGFFASWTVLALGIAATALAWYVQDGQWEEAEAVKYQVFRRLAGDPAEPACAPRLRLVAALAAGTALFAAGTILGASLSLFAR